MKYAALALALAATALAQDISTEVPSCATECIDVATVGDKIAGCSQGDIKCVCSNDQFLDNIACCLKNACDQKGQDQAVSLARQICSGAGVDVPDEVVCSNPSAAASKTGDDDPEETGDSDSDDDDDAAGAMAVPLAGSVAAVLAALALL